MLIRTTTSRRRTTRLVLNIAYESRVFLMALAVATPGLATAIVLLWRVADLTTTAQWEITAALFVATLFLAGALRRHIVVPLQTVANLIAALREGDFSVRGREGRPGTELTHERRRRRICACRFSFGGNTRALRRSAFGQQADGGSS